jgi:hypothetical protein
MVLTPVSYFFTGEHPNYPALGYIILNSDIVTGRLRLVISDRDAGVDYFVDAL